MNYKDVDRTRNQDGTGRDRTDGRTDGQDDAGGSYIVPTSHCEAGL